MVRKLVLAVAAASALMSSNMVQALGVGEINLRSALNQPLDAEIELLQVRDLTSSEIRSVLASPDDFGKAGIDRSFFLTDLTFTPMVRPDGKAFIKVTSSRPVKEPYLNFLMEVRWPSGRVLREFTLLLDPPLYQPTPITASAAATPPASTTSGTLNRPSASAPASAPAASAPVRRAAPAAQPATSADGQWQTSRADTLWAIALQSRPQGASVHQTMLAIQDLNPNAFIGNNINNLKAGQTLTLPTAEQAAVRNRADAVAQVSSQTAAWQNRQPTAEPAPRQLDARERSTAGAAPAQSRNEDSLRLVAGADEASDNNTDSAEGQNGGLRDALDRTKEQLDSAEREKTELNERLADIQGQLETLQRLLELKDAQLAALQQELSGNDELPDILPVPEENPVADEVIALDSLEQPVDADSLPGDEVAADSDAESGGGDEEANDDNEQVAVVPAVVPASEAPPPPADNGSTPVQPTPTAPSAEQSAGNSPEALLQRFMQNQSLLFGTGAVALLMLLLILMAIARRNARREAEAADSFMAESAIQETAADEGDDFNVALADVQDEAPQDMDIARDPLTEADALIAYGKLDEAAEVLQAAIDQEPERTDLRLKMMEVEALRENLQGYSEQAQALRSLGVDGAAVEMMHARYPLMAAGLMTGAALLDAGVAAEEDELDDPQELVADAAASAQEPALLDGEAEEFDFSNFGLEEETAASLAGDAGEEIGFDLDFDLDEELPAPAASDLEAALDTSPELLETEQPLDVSPLAEASIDDFDLNLDDELQADNLLAEFEAMGLADTQQPGETAGDIEPVAPTEDDSFTLTDDDLAGFEAQLQTAMQAEQGLEQQDTGNVGFATTANEGPMSADGLDEDFDFLSDTDECATKLDLARAYIDMGDEEGARDILAEVVEEGTEQQQQDAREMMGQLG